MEKQAVEEGKSIYAASPGEVFLKNFLAGFGHALGGVVVYLLLLVAVYFLFMSYVMPKLAPVIATMNSFTKSIESLSTMKTGGIVIPNNLNLQKLFGQ